VHLTLKNRSKVKFKVTYVKVIPYFLYVFYRKFLPSCNIKANKLHFVHLTLKNRSKVKFKVAYVKVIYGFLYVFYSNRLPICNIKGGKSPFLSYLKTSHAEQNVKRVNYRPSDSLQLCQK
jgi:hypothetical protein